MCAVVYASAQEKEVDSLEKVLPSLHDTDRVDYLNELSNSYSYISKSSRR
jgi:hypothetical protein